MFGSPYLPWSKKDDIPRLRDGHLSIHRASYIPIVIIISFIGIYIPTKNEFAQCPQKIYIYRTIMKDIESHLFFSLSILREFSWLFWIFLPMGWHEDGRLDCSQSPSCWMVNLLVVFRTGQPGAAGPFCMDNSRPVNTIWKALMICMFMRMFMADWTFQRVRMESSVSNPPYSFSSYGYGSIPMVGMHIHNYFKFRALTQSHIILWLLYYKSVRK